MDTTPRVLRLVSDSPDLDPVEAFVGRYTNARTADKYLRVLRQLYRETGIAGPEQLTEQTALHWCAGNGQGLANNTIRDRASLLAQFLGWSRRQGMAVLDPSTLTERHSPIRRYRRTYGKAQAVNPARWLDRAEAFATLVPACQDGTDAGLRDELVIRLGLAGMRATEIGTLTVGDLDLRGNHVTWTGKGYKARRVAIGTQLRGVIVAYLDRYSQAVTVATAPR